MSGTRMSGTVFVAVLALVASLAGPLGATVTADAEGGVLGREAQLTPQELGDGALDGLQYADAADGLSLVDPPSADNQGGAQLAYPLLVPRGRAGVQPDLTLSYDSGGDSGWAGLGWDLGVGAVTIDTRWGAPRYSATLETETYALDGAMLSPTAVRSAWAPRVAERSDWTRRVETEYERIIRHGDGPTSYWWEVTDKHGTTRYYGGTPEGTRDPSAILSDDAGNAYRWALSGVRDISSNVMRLRYVTVTGARVGSELVSFGRGHYLASILYSGSLADGNADDPAYEIRFLRDGDVTGEVARQDVVIDASGGFAEVTSDLLRRVEIWYGVPAGGAPRTYGTLVGAYAMHYTQGAFGKSLLSAVDQIGGDNQVYATHTFTYYDDVRQGGSYAGFAPEATWNAGDDDLDELLLFDEVGLSVLGASETNVGDVRAYLGFNPAAPGKTGSFGGSIFVSGGATEALAEMMDLNGDQLPDKVFRDGDAVLFRLNQSGPDGGTTFGAAQQVVDLSALSREFSVGFGGALEAWFGVNAQFSVSGNVTIGEEYFTDVNVDGLPDFVDSGTVHFNHLVNGVPTFTTDSGDTAVPIDDGTLALPALPALSDIEAQQRSQSLLEDTVRRWIAPYGGTVAITGDVTFDPPEDAAGGGDGVRVAIQRGGSELWSSTLSSGGATVTPTGVASVAVSRGQALYFRVGSVDDGVGDQVQWDPTITYLTYGATPAVESADVNGLSQRTYTASDDFTLAGRPGAEVLMPLAGTVQFDALLTKTVATTDDLTVYVLHNGAPVITQAVAAGTTGAIPITGTFSVAGPTGSSADRVQVLVRVDSPIDVTALTLTPSLHYTSVTDPAVQTHGPGGEPLITVDLPYDIDLYPENDRTVPPVASTTLSGTHTVQARVGAFPGHGGSEATLTVKTPAGLVAKATFTVPDGGEGRGQVSVTFQNGTPYFFDISIRNPELSDRVTSSVVGFPNADDTITALPSTRNWAGRQGVFPIGHRGWAYAGYNADGGRATAALDETAFVFTASELPDQAPDGFDDPDFSNPTEGDAYPFTAYQLDLRNAAGQVVGTVPVWRGFKDSLVGGGGFARSSRTATERFGLAAAGAGVRAPTLMGLTGPTLALVAGIGPLSASLGTGVSEGLIEYTDLNGDSFPDVVAPGSVQYTGPRGGFVGGGTAPGGAGLPTVNADTTFAAGGGFSGSPVEVKGNASGDANTAQDTRAASGGARGRQTGSGSASTGDDAAGEEYGANVGGVASIGVSITNPVPGDPTASAVIDALDFLSPDALEQGLADVNGDGLPDRVAVDQDGVRVRLNLGYAFSTTELRWASGSFEAGEAYSGSVGPTLGFSINGREFSGGLSLSESVDFPRYAWVDVDGDGLLDRLRKDGDEIRVAFGSGAGVLPEVDYGDFVAGDFELIGDIPTGQQVAQGRSRGNGGGFDFTISIGPLCLVACYLIINPGAHFEHTISTNQVQLTDVNGDGYADSVRSDDDDELRVRLNTRGRTNLLRTVTNPLGGEIRLDYHRDGNTVAQPFPQWVLSTVEVDDHRPGDGPDVQLTTYSYGGNVFNPLEREILGYQLVVEQQRAYTAGVPLRDAPLLRQVERRYRNATIFDAGLLVSERLLDPAGTPLAETRMSWELVDLATGLPANLEAADPAGVALLSLAVGPVRTRVEQLFYDTAGNPAQQTRTDFAYDALGNVTEIVELGELELASDDLRAVITYPDCTTPGDSWVSVPATYTLFDAAGEVLRHRDGTTDLCVNSVPIHLEEDIGGGEVAVTDLTFDSHGNYNQITYPENADGERYTVDYVYDDDRVTDVAQVTDSHGLTASATYDSTSGGPIASRTDPNGNTTTYTYDPMGRLATLTGPYEQGTGIPSVTIAYFPQAPGYAYATASHYDVFNPGDRIETAAFLDGIGRETQTKQDATVFRGQGLPAQDVVVVAGAVEFDALGRPVREWYPTEEPLGTLGTYNTGTSPTPTVTSWDLRDRVTSVVEPNGATTTLNYGYGGASDLGADLFITTLVDPQGKAQVSASDVRDHVLAIDDRPVGAPQLRTRYTYDGLGQLLTVVDPAGNTTTHTYDLLGRRTATDTPDGGLRESIYDPAGNVIEFIDPVGRAAGQHVFYAYDHERLTAIEYEDATPDVAYTYGDPGAPGNGAGRVVGVLDGAREQTLAYDSLGAVARETSTMLVHNLNDGTEQRLTFSTDFTYDGLGRLATLTYPDGEVLTHDYDSGGLLRSVQGAKGAHAYPYVDRLEYDQFLDQRFVDLGNGALTEHTYDPLTRRVARIRTTIPTREVQDQVYDYDLVGNVRSVVNDLPAPQSSLMGGPSVQGYAYDPYYRLIGATGSYRMAPNKVREYAYALGYDSGGHGNVVLKHQLDEIVQGRNRILQRPTSYTFNPITYAGDGPHQMTRIATLSYSYDVNGNATGWTDDATGQRRTHTFDAEDRLTSIADQGSTTTYTYDAQHQLAIERGPGGETSFVNPWYTVRNGTVAWKHVFAGDQRIATQRAFDDGSYEHMRYFLHADLLGSTNLLTDDRGLVFQHLEYFPSGEIWVHEHSDVHRTPYLYTGEYFDEVRRVLSLGRRWYDPREQRFYTPDPVLYADPLSVVDDPALLPAYSYAESNPLRLVDRDGLQPGDPRDDLAADPSGGSAAAPPVPAAQDPSPSNDASVSRVRAAKAPEDSRRGRLQAFSERFAAKPLIQVNLNRGPDGWSLQDVKLAPLFTGPQLTIANAGAGVPSVADSAAPDAGGGQVANAPPSASGADPPGDPPPALGAASGIDGPDVAAASSPPASGASPPADPAAA